MDFKRATFAIMLDVMLLLIIELHSFILALKLTFVPGFSVGDASLCSDSLCDQVIYGRDQVASSTWIVFTIAIHHVLRGKRHIYFTFCLLAHSISKDTSSWECPACSTPPLLKNLGIAVWKFFPDIVMIGQIWITSNGFFKQRLNWLITRCRFDR